MLLAAAVAVLAGCMQVGTVRETLPPATSANAEQAYAQGDFDFFELAAKQGAIALDKFRAYRKSAALQQQLLHERDRLQLLLDVLTKSDVPARHCLPSPVRQACGLK